MHRPVFQTEPLPMLVRPWMESEMFRVPVNPQ